MRGTRVTPPDAIAFLLMESRRRPMHMGGLQVFTPPEGSGPDFVRRTYAAMRACADVAPMFAGHPVTVRGRPVILGWTCDGEVDLDHHVRYTTLPAPAGKAELFEMISRLHGSALDRRKPLWEVHVIDGLENGRFAVFTKAHHALFDGVSFLSLLRRSLNTDPHDGQVRVLWSQRPKAIAEAGVLSDARVSWRERMTRSTRSVGEARRSATLIRAALRERELFPAFRAPRTKFNARSEVPWVCAIQPWPIQRVENITRAAGVSVNDVALAMCAGALRAYLAEREELPDTPLVAVSPVDLRTDRDVEGRNVITSALCNLATDLEDPVKRLSTIHASMRYNTQFLRGLPRQMSIYLAGFSMPITDGSRLGAKLPLQFNLGISHVADAKRTLYLDGARLEGTYGFPPTLRGHALNIGLASNAVSLNFAIVGCAAVVPDLECLLDHLEVSLKDLERAVGV
jgi:diacylglycerol O-acyltransferase